MLLANPTASYCTLYPKEITFQAYKYMINYRNVWPSYRNTIFVTVVGTINSLVWTSLGGYALSRRDLPGRTVMTLFIIFTMYFGGGLIPTYLNLRRLGFLNTLWVMIIPDAIATTYLLYFRNFFMSLPNELKESAYIDGASEFTTFLKIILPMSAPIYATMALFYGVSNWNEYSTPLIYNSKQEYWTIQVIIQRMYTASVEKNLGESTLDDLPPSESVKAAAVVFATLPILCVYPFLQKYFVQGIIVAP